MQISFETNADGMCEMVKKVVRYEDRILSEPFNFYGMYLNITDEDWEMTLNDLVIEKISKRNRQLQE